MTLAQMIEAARKCGFESELGYGNCRYKNLAAVFTPTASRTTWKKFKGRVNWKIDGNPVTKAAAAEHLKPLA